MTENRHGRRRIVRPGDRELSRVKLILLALMLLASSGILALLLTSGLHEGALSLSLPSYRLFSLAKPKPGIAEEIPVGGSADTFSVSDVETLYSSVEAAAPAAQMQPQILIYHTHATEAYLQTEGQPYVESGKWRTRDPEHSVIAVGALLADTLRESYGLSVLHDTTNHEPPKLSTAYNRSLSTMLSYRTRYPSLRVYIDVHRDAYGTSGEDDGQPKDYVVIDGRETARIMFVVGTGRGATGAGFDELPDFDANYAFAENVTTFLNEAYAGLTRDIRVKSGRYNQHVSTRCLLAEVGHNANTLEQALASVPYLAAAIDRALSESAIETASISDRGVWTPQEPFIGD